MLVFDIRVHAVFATLLDFRTEFILILNLAQGIFSVSSMPNNPLRSNGLTQGIPLSVVEMKNQGRARIGP